MFKLKPRRLITSLAVLVLLVGSYISWQLYQGQQLAKRYVADAQRQAQGTSTQLPSGATLNPASPAQVPAAQTPTAQTPSAQTPTAQTPASPAAPNSSSPPTDTPPAVDYKQLMSSTYQQTLQTMQNVKGNTLALQGRKLSLSAYKASILQAQATFNSAEAYVRANPPADTTLNASYQQFLAGITLAKDSMSVVLDGISSLSPASLYAARDMGGNAQQQVIDGYGQF